MPKTTALALVVAFSLALLAGCASSVEKEEHLALASQVYKNRAEVNKLSSQMEAIRRPAAETAADLSAMRQELARLRGQIEEMQHQMGQLPDPAALSRIEQKVGQSSSDVDGRLAKVEAYLGIKDGQTPPKPAQAAAPAAPAPEPEAPKGPKGLYDLAFRLYKNKSWDAARDRFEEVAKKYPKSNYADNAYYWTGESYYNQKKFEEAILAYNQVIKRFPKSEKVPAAMLKQGLSFRALGDKRTAGIVLKKLVKEHPKSSQATIARKVLAKL